MNRQRILLLENDGPTESFLCDLFADEGLDVTVCRSLPELLAGVVQYPHAAIVSDSWAKGEYQTLTPQHRAEIVALARTAEVVLTTGRGWARRIQKGELGTATIVEKPYDLTRLMTAVRTTPTAVGVGSSIKGQIYVAGCRAKVRSTTSHRGGPARLELGELLSNTRVEPIEDAAPRRVVVDHVHLADHPGDDWPSRCWMSVSGASLFNHALAIGRRKLWPGNWA